MILRMAGAFSFVAATGGCLAHVEPNAVLYGPEAVEVILVENDCGIMRPGVEVFREAESWKEWLNARSARNPLQRSSVEAVELDFSHNTAIVVAMGQKTTPGFSIDFANAEALLRGTTLEVSSIWLSPAKEAILPQVVTSPCVAVIVPFTRYDSVTVTDQFGEPVIVKP